MTSAFGFGKILGGGVKGTLYGSFPCGNWKGTVTNTIPCSGTCIVVRVWSHGLVTENTLTIGGKQVPISTTVGSVKLADDVAYYITVFEAIHVTKGDSLVLTRTNNTGSSVQRPGMYAVFIF